MPANKVMDEFKAGTLKTGSGHMVTSMRQAKAIAANMARKERANTQPKKSRIPMRGKDFFLKIGV